LWRFGTRTVDWVTPRLAGALRSARRRTCERLCHDLFGFLLDALQV
jgi:hypothetical protein